MTSEIEEKVRQLAPVDPRLAERAWLLYLSGEGGERAAAEELLDVLLFQQARKDYRKAILLDPPSRAACAGEYQLGRVMYPPGRRYCPFGLREDEWTRHVLIVGMTGTGKTTLAFHLLRELRRHGKPFLVFDWKRNYRDLRQLPELQETLVFTVGRDVVPFRFNPLLPPPGTAPGQWLMKLVDVAKTAYFVGEGVEYLLREAIDAVYEECGFFDGARTHVPRFVAVRDYVQRRRVQGRMMLWKASALRVLESLCFRHGLGPVVNTVTTWDHERVLAAPVVLELDTLSDADKIFLTEALILWLYEYRKVGKREAFTHALLIEEGHHILSRLKERSAGAETIMETCLRQIREFGEAVVVIDQEPTKLSNSIKANTYCKIAFTLGNGKDIHDIARCLSLTEDEERGLPLLQVGHAIVGLRGRVTTPLHVAFPHVPIQKGTISDDELRESR